MANRVNTAKRKRYMREYMRSKRAAAKAQEIAKGAQKNLLDFPADPASAIAQWSKTNLVVPPSHPLEGKPLELPDFGIQFLKPTCSRIEKACYALPGKTRNRASLPFCSWHISLKTGRCDVLDSGLAFARSAKKKPPS